MKKVGAIVEFAEERMAELYRIFCGFLADRKVRRVSEIYRLTVEAPASRFWVSEERAASVVSMLLRGKVSVDELEGPKGRMFAEILRRVKEAEQAQPHLPLAHYVREAVNSSAPEHYMTPMHARYLIGKYRREKRTRRVR